MDELSQDPMENGQPGETHHLVEGIKADLQARKERDKPIEVDVPFSPFNHTTAEVPLNETLTEFGSPRAGAPKETPGYLEGSLAQWEEKNDTWRLAHGAWDRDRDYLYGYKDPNFNPKEYPEKFLNVKSEYQSYLLGAENEDQMNLRLKRIQHEQWLNQTVADGSWMQWISGGGVALGTDLFNYIPVISQIKYANLGKTVLNSMMRAVPGALAYGVGSSLGTEMDKINGNVHDFMIDSAIRSVFATALFAGGAPMALAADKMELWKLQSYIGDQVKGIGYKLKVGEKGEVEGMQAYAMRDSVGADKVQLAQDKADSAFYKGTVFKIPYIGTAAEKFMSNRFFGSNTLSMLLNPYDAVRQHIDAAYDHGIITKGLAEGKPKMVPFFTRILKTVADIKNDQVIANALFMQRNGIKSDNYIAQNAYKLGLSARQKTLEKIQADIGDKPYITPEKFYEEVNEVMHSQVPHENAAVNELAAHLTKSEAAYYDGLRKAYNLPADWMPPRTSRGYASRVYDTNYMNNKLEGDDGWTEVISKELRDQDALIIQHTQPIKDITAKIEAHTIEHDRLTDIPNVTDAYKKQHRDELVALKAQKKALEEELQDKIRTDPELHLMADDWNALSATEAKELQQITKKRDIAKEWIEKEQKNIQKIKDEAAKRKQSAAKSATVKTAKNNKQKAAVGEQIAEKEEARLAEVKAELEQEEANLQALAASGKINSRFYYKPKESNVYIFRDHNERLKLRKTYHEQVGYRADEETAHGFRKEAARGYYYTIMNQTAEDTVNQIMSKFTGNAAENPIKQRTLMIRDEVLYKYNFLSKDIMARSANYKMWMARRTHLKNTYEGATLDGGIESLFKQHQEQYEKNHLALSTDKAKFEEKLKNPKLTKEEKEKLEKGLKQAEDALKKDSADFNRGKKQMQFVYEKQMGISKLGLTAKKIAASAKSFNVAANLGFLPATMITDLFANGLKQGIIPFVQSGLYPAIQSLGGLLKTNDSASFRGTMAALNLALHHISSATTSRMMDNSTNPILNLGKIPNFLDKTAHLASNISLTTTIDNFLQQVTSAIAQSNVIMHLVAHSEGKLSKSDRMWLNRYGIDPEKDGAKILEAFKKNGGGKSSVGGYQSNFWKWEDIESSNKVADAVFRSTHDTIISANALDAPLWLDENISGVMGPIIKGFKGWAFASLNRYLIPTMQQPDAEKLMAFVLMSASAALVSPSRRMAKGDAPYREDQTAAQITAEILLDSPQFAWLSEGLQDANLLSGGLLLGQLKNDKYYDRARIGIMGPTFSNGNKLLNFITAMGTGNMNEHDTMGMVGMIPILNSLYGYDASKNLVQGFGLPKNRPH